MLLCPLKVRAAKSENEGANPMSKTLIRIIVATLLLLACGSTPVLGDGSDPRPPFCPPGTNCG